MRGVGGKGSGMREQGQRWEGEVRQGCMFSGTQHGAWLGCGAPIPPRGPEEHSAPEPRPRNPPGCSLLASQALLPPWSYSKVGTACLGHRRARSYRAFEVPVPG